MGGCRRARHVQERTTTVRYTSKVTPETYHGIDPNFGTLCVKYEPDFLNLYEFTEMGVNMEEVEDAESAMWETGEYLLDGIMAFPPQCDGQMV